MADKFAAKLQELRFELPRWSDPASEAHVVEFEIRFGLTLPADYREFLVHHGGVIYGEAVCSFQEPTPFGMETNIEGFYGFGRAERTENVSWATKRIGGAPSVIAIGVGGLEGMIWLKCDGADAGHVYFHDGEGRSAWDDAMFYQMYPNIDPEIKHYLKLRRQGKLPARPKGYEHVYRLGKSFTEFFESLRPEPDDDEAPVPPDGLLTRLVRKITFGFWPREDADKKYNRICNGLIACDEAVLKELIAAGKLNKPLDYGWTPMQLVAGDMKAMHWLLAAGATLDRTLGMAAQSGSVDAVRFLLELGHDVEERIHGETPLMKAVEFPYPPERLGEFIEVARLLIQHGANVNAVSDDKRSVLKIAGGKRYANGKTEGEPELIAFLKSVGAKMNPK